ncbi:MAG: ComEA family DNA-binding protein [Bacilli bacterium]|nr:ComEA family DNA-binding protein [Bacilli bacterium]
MEGDSITFKYRYRKQIIIGIISLIIISSLVISIVVNLRKDFRKDIVVEKKVKKKETKIIVEEKIKVDIKGQVINPGIYSLKPDSRVIDVIAAAGGLTGEADTSVINLSKKITDEMVIIIYSKAEVADFHKTKEIEKQVEEQCHQKNEESLINDACIKSDTEETKLGKISLNKATKEELMTLPGIGESKAKEIINYREKNGPFKTIEDLKKVTGIGENIFAQIKENITV